jgi:cytoskeletal protein RodZ
MCVKACLGRKNNIHVSVVVVVAASLPWVLVAASSNTQKQGVFISIVVGTPKEKDRRRASNQSTCDDPCIIQVSRRPNIHNRRTMKIPIFLSNFVWTTAVFSVSATSLRTSFSEQQNRILQESTRTDLVRLVPFDVQVAISYNTQEDLEAINVVALTDVVTDWMSESFRLKSTSQLLEEAEGNSTMTSFDSVALELADQRIQTSSAANQPIALITISYEGVSLWERAGSALPMDPELVELMQRATFLEDNALLELLQQAPVEDTRFPSQESAVDVRAFITPPSSTRPPSQTASDNTEENDNKNLEIIIIIAIVVACLAFGLLIFAVLWAWKSDQKKSNSTRASSSKQRSSRMSKASSKKKTNKALTEESTPSPNARDPLEGSEFDFGGAAIAGSAAKTKKNKGAALRQEPEIAAAANDPYAADSIVSEDVSNSLTAYYKSGKYSANANADNKRDYSKDFNDAASMSSMDSYGYSLDGYAPSLGPAPQGGYPVGPLQAAKDAAITVGDEDEDLVPAAAEEEVEDYEAQT